MFLVHVHISFITEETNINDNDDNPECNVVIESSHVTVPDGGYGWLVVFSSYMVHFIIGNSVLDTV